MTSQAALPTLDFSVTINLGANEFYKGDSAINCEECGDPIPENRKKAIACKYCLACQTALENNSR
jgi:RNA polymerase-binding transcription factor DksA